MPAYIILCDAVLRQMALPAPRTKGDMLALSSVRLVKVEHYGNAFLELLCGTRTQAVGDEESGKGRGGRTVGTANNG